MMTRGHLSMKFKHAARAITVVLICMMLTAGCAGSKLSMLNPGIAGRTTDDNDAKQPGAIELSNANTNAATANEGSVVSEDNANNGSNITGSAVDPNNQAAKEQAAAAARTPVKVKALYLTGWTVGSTKKVEHYIDLARNTEINSYVIDIKDDDGYVGYESNVPVVKENGTWMKKYNADTVIKAFHENNVHLIGRIVAFKDPVYSVKRPDLAIKDVRGGLWKDNNGKTWLNPYNKENWDYLVSIAKEAIAKGFDEIQFDYVRFPSDGKKKNMDFSSYTDEKYKAIGDFLAYAKSQISEVPVSADVFGIVLESPADTEGIGQYLEYVGMDVDYISPMVYPSHYAYGQIVNKVEFKAPDLEPYAVVYNTLVKGKDRISKVSGYNAKVRPYLQDFTASWLRPKSMYQQYGDEQVRQQIKAVYDAGYEEWILWDAGNSYDENALLKENT